MIFKSKYIRGGTVYDDETTFEGNRAKGWSTNEMFAAVQTATGRSIDYSGNPNEFEGHPMYRNYNAISKMGKANMAANKNGDAELFDFNQLSAQSSSFDNFKKDEKSGKIEYNTPFSVNTPHLPDAPVLKADAAITATNTTGAVDAIRSQRKLDIGAVFKVDNGEGVTLVDSLSEKPISSLLQSEKPISSLLEKNKNSVNFTSSTDFLSSSISGGFEVGFITINDSSLADLLTELNPSNMNSSFKRSCNIRGDSSISLESLLLSHFA